MNLFFEESDDFKVQIPWLPTDREVTDAASHQPDPSASTADSVFNLAKNLSEVGIFKTKAGRHLDHRVAEERRCFFRRHRVDVKTGPPFEAGDLHQFGDDLQVPMVVIAGLLMKG